MKVVEKMLDWENAGSSKLLSVGYSLRAPELLFRKMEDEEVNGQIEKLYTNDVRKIIFPNGNEKIFVAGHNGMVGSSIIRCLKKKKQLFVSNLSEAINEVETNEKNNPIMNKNVMRKKIALSMFFHH